MIRAYLAREPWAWKWVEGWIARVVNLPRWVFLCERSDVIGDCQIAVCESLPDFKGNSQLKTYICRIANNICVDRYRAYLREKYFVDIGKVELVSHNPGPLDEIVGRENIDRQTAALAVILDSASQMCLELWMMHYWARITYERMAQILGVALNTVKVRAFRCRDKARKALGGDPAG